MCVLIQSQALSRWQSRGDCRYTQSRASKCDVVFDAKQMEGSRETGRGGDVRDVQDVGVERSLRLAGVETSQVGRR
ncbi:hypothetical protein ACRALDRAFT_2036201 [Sodiomyces alcalophilus JCM 7366]|uniref:uncharacterized protein n=1 Tax=Sodiomyces alcalophilus JCM 7366 TaxID=591952 RepID=UPI0039B3F2FB